MHLTTGLERLVQQQEELLERLAGGVLEAEPYAMDFGLEPHVVKENLPETEVSIRPSVSAHVHLATTTDFDSIDQEDSARKTQAQARVSTVSHSDSTLAHRVEGIRARCNALLRSHRFEFAVAMMILSNSVFVGVQVEWSAGHPLDKTPLFFFMLEYTYASLFFLELMLRLFVHGREFLTMDSWAWNLLDAFIVAISIMELTFDILFVHSGADEKSDMQNVTHIRMIRILRISRIIRALRIPHVVSFVSALRTLIYSIVVTMKSLVWAMVLLALEIYIFSIIFTQVSNDYLLADFWSKGRTPQEGSSAADLEKYWRHLPDAMLTLYMSITGGVSWVEASRPLREIHILLEYLFCFYVSFSLFAVLNVITGVFCNSAIESATHDPSMIVQSISETRNNYEQHIRDLFADLDKDHSGQVTIDELESTMKQAQAQAYFSALELESTDLWTLFKLLDNDKTGTIDFSEFVFGIMRLRGSAKSVDVAKLMYDFRWFSKKVV